MNANGDRSPLTLGVALTSGALLVTCTQPWTTVAFPELFHQSGESAAHRTTHGFVCLVVSALTLLIAAIERTMEATSEYRRSCATILVVGCAVATGVLILAWLSGTVDFRGVSTVRTWWFHAALALAATSTACAYANARRVVSRSLEQRA